MAETPHDDIHSGHEPPNDSFDWEEFGYHLEDSDLSDEQKQDFIETLFGIMLSFVDLGYGLHPVQQACEQNRETAPSLPADLLFLDNPDNQSDNAAHDALRNLADKEES